MEHLLNIVARPCRVTFNQCINLVTGTQTKTITRHIQAEHLFVLGSKEGARQWQQGDVLLFEEKSFDTGDIFGDLIVEFTHGPFVHSEVQTDDAHSIGEIELGLEAHPIPTTYKSVVTIPIKGAIETGLAWVGVQDLAALQQKRAYGFASLANAAFKMLHLPFRIAIPNEWDCSEFVTFYLEQAKAVPPKLAALLSDRSTISPNDIARAFGILPPKSKPALITSAAKAAYR